MKESLESARNIHQILIVVCTIIGIFVVSIKPSGDQYSPALKELNTFQSTIDSVNAFRKEILKQAMYRVINKDSLEKFKSKVTFQDQSSYSASSVAKVYNGIISVWADLDTMNTIYPLGTKPTVISTAVGNEIVDFRDLPLQIATNGDGWGHGRLYDPRANYKFQFAKNGILDASYDPKTLTPNLRKVWIFIKDLNFDDAKTHLTFKAKEYADAADNNVDLSGLKVAGEYMYIVGPFAALALMLYLTTLVIHLINILKLKEDANIAFSFPWLGLFQNKASQSIAALSISLYPLSVSLLIVCKADLTDVMRTSISIIYFFGFGILSVILMKKLSFLKSEINRKMA